MAETIQIDKKLASRILGNTEELMSHYAYETNGGQSVYECSYCGAFKYGSLTGVRIQHHERCLGVAIMAELEKAMEA
jgi:hypothetical protein